MRVTTIALGWVLISVGPAYATNEPLPSITVTRTGYQMVADAPASGIKGRVSIRPVRSVERRGVINERPYQAKIAVVDAKGRNVAAVESDAEGRFQLRLPPGSYVLRPESPGVYPRASEQRVAVRRNEMTQVEIVYDSGMR